MKTQIRKLKLNLKEIAKNIKNQKNVRKKSHPHHDLYKGDYHVLCLKDEFRHKHVAYCLARGRTLEQVDSGNKLSMDRVNWIIKSMDLESKEKLYVVVNENLTSSQQAVQSAHAVAQFMRENPNTMWSNGYLILLKGSPAYMGSMRCYRTSGCEHAEFVEPDLNNVITAYAVFGPDVERLMKNFKLV